MIVGICGIENPMIENQPQIESAKRLEVYSFGEYSAVLLGDIVSSGPDVFKFMLVVVEMKTRQPALFITSEAVPSPVSRSKKNPSHFLRIRPGRQRGVPYEELPPSHDWVDSGKFAYRAVTLTKEWIAKKEEPKMAVAKKKSAAKKPAKKVVKKVVKKAVKKAVKKTAKKAVKKAVKKTVKKAAKK
jgi:hypothetical protein